MTADLTRLLSFSALAFFLGLAQIADLRAQGLPPVPVPANNPITPEKAVLGKLLFWEEQLSSNNRVACGTCHTFAAGGGDSRRAAHPGLNGSFGDADDKMGSPGVRRSNVNNRYLSDPLFGTDVQVTPRSSPSFLTAAYFPELFWDGRAGGQFIDPETNTVAIPSGGALESQAVEPILAGNEMSHDGRLWGDVVTKLQSVRPMALATNLPADMAAAIAGGATYSDLFQAAFGTPAITAARIGFALATYQRTLVPDQTPWDRFISGQQNAMTPAQVRGWDGFRGPSGCAQCHQPPLFSDRTFRNLGLRPIAEDNGRQGVTNSFADRGKFKVPSLRNAGLRRSFMHDGRFNTLPQAVGFYGGPNPGGPNLDNKDPALQNVRLPPPGPPLNDLINFLTNALTDPRVVAGQFPFDRPTLLSERIPPGGTLFGQATPGGGGLRPQMIAEVPANIGNVDFKVGLGNATGGALAVLMVADARVPAGTQVGGTNVNIDITSPLIYLRTTQGPAQPGRGFTTVQEPLPDEPALVGLTMFGQWFVFEPGLPTVAASSRGAEISFF
jgi:cytochrome c peroxidase